MLDKIINKCMNVDENERPDINELIKTFFINSFDVNDGIIQNDEIMSNKNIIFDIVTKFYHRYSEYLNNELSIN